jgi:NADH-quinone oxidoreductase subunit K
MLLYILPGILLYLVGIIGIILTRKSVVLVLMSIELMLIGINVNFIVGSVYMDDIMGEVISLYILTVAAAEAAIGLAVLVLYYRLRGVIDVNLIHILKG